MTVEMAFSSPLLWVMFGLGVLGSLVACSDWLSRFCFAWTMVLAYFLFWSLLMLVAAFSGKRRIMHAYQHAVQEKYRFFSYGDAMFLTPDQQQ